MKKINNKILFLALIGLAAVFAFSKVMRAPKLESNLKKELLVLDSVLVTEIRLLNPENQNKAIRISREGNRWMVTQDSDNRKYPADASSVKNLLKTLRRMDVERMVSRKKEKWENLKVGENGTEVSVLYGTEEKARIHIGKSGFREGRNGSFGGGTYTYVRLHDEPETYQIAGYLEGTFNKSFNDWRDKSFLKISKDSVKKIAFRYPADSSYVLEKKDTVWYVGNKQAGESKVNAYLSRLSDKKLYTFADDFKPKGAPDILIEIEGKEGMLGSIEAWKNDEGEWNLRSSIQEDIFFSGSGSVVNELLVAASFFEEE